MMAEKASSFLLGGHLKEFCKCGEFKINYKACDICGHDEDLHADEEVFSLKVEWCYCCDCTGYVPISKLEILWHKMKNIFKRKNIC